MLRKIIGFIVAVSVFSLVPAHAQPDLVASVTSVTPSSVTPGSSISIGWKVTNQGSSSAGASGLKLYLSRDQILDASDTYLTPSVSVSNMNSGGSMSGTVSRTVPAGTATGAWYIFAEADGFQAVSESQEGNNVGAPLSFTVSSCGSPGAFNLSSPVNGSAQPSATISLSLMWGASAGASSYDVYFGPSPNPPILVNQMGTNKTVSVAAGNTYYWKIVAKNSCGQTSAPVSGTWTFSVAIPPTCSSPGTFNLTSPSNGASFPSGITSVNLTWGTASGANSYDLYFGTTTNPPFLVSQSGTSRSVNISAGQTYYWKVIAKDSCGQPASSSGPWSFSVAQPSGSLIVSVQDQAGNPRPGAKVVRYPHGSGTALDTVTTDAAGQTPAYTNIPPGTSYDFEAYYEGTNPFDTLGELWATATATLTSGANSLTLRRDWPYVESLRIFRVFDNLELTGSSELFPGDEIRVEAVIRNLGSSDRSATIRIALDRDRVAPWDFDTISSSVVVPAGNVTLATKWTVLQGGTFFKSVRTEVTPGGETDAWDWSPGFVMNADPKVVFGGLTWDIKTSLEATQGPGSNYWSPSHDTVWKEGLEGNEKLHLRIVRKGDKWVCSEVTSEEAFGYGKYTFYVDLPTADLFEQQPSAVLALFNYLNFQDDLIDPSLGEGEIDVELGRWNGDAPHRNLQYVVQRTPRSACDSAVASGCRPFDVPLSLQTTHIFRWTPGQVDFKSSRGHSLDPLDADVLASGSVTTSLPVPGGEKVHLSFWLGSVPPSGVDSLEVVISGFKFEPLAPAIEVTPTSNDFGTVAMGLTADRSFTVRNAGGETLSGSATSSTPFSIISGGTYNLAAGASQAVGVRFTPAAAQTYNGAVTFSGGGGTVASVTGIGTTAPAPVLSVSPVSRVFGSVAVGSSADLSFTVQNTGGGTLAGSASVPAPFSIVSGSPYSLTAGQSIYVWARFAPTSAQDSTAAVSFSGASGASATVSGTGISPQIPTPDPSWLRVATASQTQLNLQWDDNSANEDGFKIERKQGCCGPWTEIATLPTNSTTYASTGLTCNTIYAYRVWAYNAAGASGKTNEANNTTSACSSATVPTPDPSWLRVSAASLTQINLQWDDNSTNEDGFKVERKEGCCGPWTEIATLPANSTTYQSGGLTCGGTYAYRVWAFNTQGNSGKTNEAAATTPGC
jgi:hypothetical protein